MNSRSGRPHKAIGVSPATGGIGNAIATESCKGVLFVLAHTDDEYFFTVIIQEAVRAGRPVHCIFTTDGAKYGVAPEIRTRESLRALQRFDVDERQVRFVGLEAGIPDGSSHLRLEETYQAVCQAVRYIPIDEIYVLAWEGGHVDHDASHLVGAALARAMGIDRVYECPVYSAWQAGMLPFSVMRWIPRPVPITTREFGFFEGWKFFSTLSHYRSQWKTFSALSPGLFLRFVIHRRHECRPAMGIDYAIRPHPGPLFYEKRFGVSYPAFAAAAEKFIAQRILLTAAPELTRPGDFM